MIRKIKVIYKLDKKRINTKFDREIEKFFEGYGLECDGRSFDFVSKERNLYFYKKEGEK